jgi:proteic killer suppression protein
MRPRCSTIYEYHPAIGWKPLHGDRQGQFSIRVNDQWCICFVWRDIEAWDVEIVDYH